MSLPVFIADLSQLDTLLSLPEEQRVIRVTGAEAKHISVRRLAVGQSLLLADGAGTQLLGSLLHVDSRECHVRIERVDEISRPTPEVTVIQALPKSDRAELAVDLMTESGVDHIIPWQARNCVAKWRGKEEKSRAKWENAAKEAAKQSRRSWVPSIGGLVGEGDVVKLIRETVANSGVVAVLHESESAKFIDFAQRAAHAKRVVFIVGPEGGVSPEELEVFREAGAESIVLGPTVLRTALAGSAALNALGPLTSRWNLAEQT